MLLTIDVGNTNVVFAVFDKDTIIGQWRISTDPHRTADEYGVWLIQVLEHEGIKPSTITGAVVSSVVPQSLYDLRSLTRRYFDVELLVISDPRLDIALPISVKLPHPEEVGADRLVNAAAAWQHYQSALIVVDFGTATTFDVVNDQAEYIGGVIAPGVNLSLEALEQAAAKLPTIPIQPTVNVVGNTTVTAMQSGIYHGYASMLEGMITKIKHEYNGDMQVISTGGLAPLYAKSTSLINDVDQDLTIKGLKDLYSNNKHLVQ